MPLIRLDNEDFALGVLWRAPAARLECIVHHLGLALAGLAQVFARFLRPLTFAVARLLLLPCAQKDYGWKSLGSNVNGVTAVIVIRARPECQ